MNERESRNDKRKVTLLFAGVTAAILFAAVISICVGKYPITPWEIWSLLRGGADLFAGMGLGLAGCVYQILFKKPLASPDIIGVAGGANLGATVVIVSVSSSGMLSIAAGAFWGGLSAVLGVMLLVRVTRSRSTSTYVLAGIVFNAISKAVIMALKYFADPDNELAAMEYWEMGTFGNTTLSKLVSVLPMFVLSVA